MKSDVISRLVLSPPCEIVKNLARRRPGTRGDKLSMLAVCAAAYAFVVPPPRVAPTVQRNAALPQSSTLRMGFFDDIKKGFENDEKLEKKGGVDATPGKTKNVAGYVKKKENMRQTKQVQQKPDDPGEDRMAELLGKFKW